jgi:tetratricopeptide (TPR) repeat protein
MSDIDCATVLSDGQQALRVGDLERACVLFNQVLELAPIASDGDEESDEHLISKEDALLALAETEWRLGSRESALARYDSALEFVRGRGDIMKEAAVCLGKGFALLESTSTSSNADVIKHPHATIAHLQDAVECLERSRQVSEDESQIAQIKFIDGMLNTARARLAVALETCGPLPSTAEAPGRQVKVSE